MTHYGLAEELPHEATIRVVMQRTTKAIPHPRIGERVYEAGQEYDLPEWLAEAFFRGGEADPAEAHIQAGDAAQEASGAPVEAEAPSGGAKTRRGARGAKFGASTGV